MSGKISYLGKVRGGGKIISDDSLVLCLDAANSKSYNTSTGKWANLSRRLNTAYASEYTPVNATYLTDNKGTLKFSGSGSGMVIGTNPNFYFAGTQGFTLSIWIKPTSIVFSGLITRFNSGVIGNYYMTLEGGGMIYFHRERSPFTKAISNTILVPGTAYNVVGVYNGINMQIYINGFADGAAVASGSITANQSNINVFVGCWQSGGSASNFFPGSIYYVKIYNRALAAWEVSQNYNALKYRYSY